MPATFSPVVVSSIADGQRQFATLDAPTALPTGSFVGKMLFFDGSPLVRAIASGAWKGIDFDGARARITFPSLVSLMARPDEGPVTLATSVYDQGPCIRIDFTTGPIPRFFETRSLGDGRYFSVVTVLQPDGTPGKPSDVNVLTPRP
jgi:hypothetical protein